MCRREILVGSILTFHVSACVAQQSPPGHLAPGQSGDTGLDEASWLGASSPDLGVLRDPWMPGSPEEVEQMGMLVLSAVYWLDVEFSLYTINTARLHERADSTGATAGAEEVEGSLTVIGDPNTPNCLMSADGLRVDWPDGRFLAMDGQIETRRDAESGDSRRVLDLSYEARGLPSEDRAVVIASEAERQEDGSSEASGYLWVQHQDRGSTGDLNFSVSVGPPTDCRFMHNTHLVMQGEAEVVIALDVEPSCEFKTTITVDGVPWE